jgi:phosphotransferase system enzyme I (PtsI)
MKLTGQGISPGLAKGKVFIFQPKSFESQFAPPKGPVSADKEIERLHEACRATVEDLEDLVETLQSQGRAEQAEIFEAHALMVQDPEVIDQTIQLIREKQTSAEYAFQGVLKNVVSIMEQMEDPYLRARASDWRDIGNRILSSLSQHEGFDFDSIKEPVIVVAHDLTPSQTISFDLKKVMGFLTEIGGATSHTAILARSLELPAICGPQGVVQKLKAGQEILIDGTEGLIALDPSPEEIQGFQKKLEAFNQEKDYLLRWKGIPSKTKDGEVIELAANIASYNDLDSVEKNDAEAIGLYRTEFVFLDRSQAPDEQEQQTLYSSIFRRLKGKKCFIRTLDIGGDKQVHYLNLPKEENPFLGLRAVRLCLGPQKGLFKTQLRAILQAAVGHQVGIMIPMISCVEEVVACKEVLEECKLELEKEGRKFSNDYQFGVMIEIPTAAMLMDHIAPLVDFISIGTNDLIQYSTAVDRLNPQIAALYNHFNPGFLRLLHRVITEARAHDVFVGICGSLAHKPELVPWFVGAGVQELSMTSQHILKTREMICSLDLKKCQQLVTEVMKLGYAKDVQTALKNFRA